MSKVGLDSTQPLFGQTGHRGREAGRVQTGQGSSAPLREGPAEVTVAEVPLDNAPEAYRVEIFDGPTLVRTLEVDTPTAVYDAADQATDFGAPPSFFDFTVSQLSPLYGDGHPGTGQFNA